MESEKGTQYKIESDPSISHRKALVTRTVSLILLSMAAIHWVCLAPTVFPHPEVTDKMSAIRAKGANMANEALNQRKTQARAAKPIKSVRPRSTRAIYESEAS